MFGTEFKTKLIWAGVAILIAANMLIFSAVRRQGAPAGHLKFFNVGQGDAIYFRSPEGVDVLIDGGPSDAILSKLGRAMPFFDHTIELVISTHPHSDHITGLIEVLKRFRVKKVLISDAAHDSATYQELQKQLHEKNIEVISPRMGQRIILDRSSVLDVLYPVDGDNLPKTKDLNNISTVLRLSLGTTGALFTGDAGTDIENILLRFKLPLESEILKVGHQGSKSSSGGSFIEAIEARYGVISVGKNSYGHPNEEVLQRLSDHGVKVLRTDQEGDLEFTLDGKGISLRTDP